MEPNINLDISSYSTIDIEQLLHLKSPYTISDINNSQQRLVTELVDKKIFNDNEQKTRVIQFIEQISNHIKSINNNDINNHTISQHGSNIIIENPDINNGKKSKIENGRVTFESNGVPAGYINPINVRTITQAISIDSRFRPNYSNTKSTNFNVTLPSIQKNVISMRISSIELPTTFYAISQHNGNSKCLIFKSDGSGKGWLLTLPDGNYEQPWANNNQAAYIDTVINNSILVAAPVLIDSNGKITPTDGHANLLKTDLVFTLDRISGKSIFKSVTGGILDDAYGFTIRFNINNDGNLDNETNIQTRLGWQLGYRSSEYKTIYSSSLYYMVSEGICLISGPRYGFISINDYQKNTGPSFIVAYADSILQDNIITRINLADLAADVGIYQNSSDPGLSTQLNRTREYFGPVDIQRLHICLYDEYGRIIDLNIMDWSITIGFELLYN